MGSGRDAEHRLKEGDSSGTDEVRRRNPAPAEILTFHNIVQFPCKIEILYDDLSVFEAPQEGCGGT
jgi:hypothetical protein